MPKFTLNNYILKDDCGMCANATEKGGIIESPHFPNAYGHNLNCLYRIKAPLRKKIKLTFTEFRVKACCDYVSVSDAYILSFRYSSS